MGRWCFCWCWVGAILDEVIDVDPSLLHLVPKHQTVRRPAPPPAQGCGSRNVERRYVLAKLKDGSEAQAASTGRRWRTGVGKAEVRSRRLVAQRPESGQPA